MRNNSWICTAKFSASTNQKSSLSGAIEWRRRLLVQPDETSAQKASFKLKFDRDGAGGGVPDKFILSVLLIVVLDSPCSLKEVIAKRRARRASVLGENAVRIHFFVSLFLPGSLYFSVTRGAVPEVVEREGKERERKGTTAGEREKKRGFRAHMKCTDRKWEETSVTCFIFKLNVALGFSRPPVLASALLRFLR